MMSRVYERKEHMICDIHSDLFMFLSFFDPIYVCKQNWEKGIELCKTLAKQYESELYDFVKLSNILVRNLIFELSCFCCFCFLFPVLS